VHPVDTADAAALDGRHVAAGVTAYLNGGARVEATVPLTAGSPFTWISPQRLSPGSATPRGDLLLWSDEYHRFPVVRACQDGKVIGERRTLWPASPGRVFRVPADIVAGASPTGGAVTVELTTS
jgi:hypothetical protein